MTVVCLRDIEDVCLVQVGRERRKSAAVGYSPFVVENQIYRLFLVGDVFIPRARARLCFLPARVCAFWGNATVPTPLVG